MPVPFGAHNLQIKLLQSLTTFAQPMERVEFMPGMFHWQAVPNPLEQVTFPAKTVFSRISAIPSHSSVGNPSSEVSGLSDPIHGVRYHAVIGTDAAFANSRTTENYQGYFMGGGQRRRTMRKGRKTRRAISRRR